MKHVLEDSFLNSVVGGQIVASLETNRVERTNTFTPNKTAFQHLLEAARLNDHGLDVIRVIPDSNTIDTYVFTPGTVIDTGGGGEPA